MEACRSMERQWRWGGGGSGEKRQGTVNTRHGSSFNVMNSNESSAGRLLGDKKSI